MLEYPKMLYNTTGGKAVAKSEADEKIWRKDGYVSFDELPEDAKNDDHINAQTYSPPKQYGIDRGNLTHVDAQVVHNDKEASVEQKEPTDYDSMTNDELRALLDARSVEHKSSDRKADLVKAAQDSE